MSEKVLRTRRIVSVIAATIISLACGTNYVYSAWGPQFASKMNLSSTQSNLIGIFANLGMYACGIPVGLLVDSKGPRPGVFIGSLSMGVGYFFLYYAYARGEGSVALPWLCLFAFFTGSGGASAFAGSIKTSALNWPSHRGTATAFPLAAFGLSAFIFATLSTAAFPHNTSDFLLLLAIGTFCLPFFSNLFLRVVPHSTSYLAVPSEGHPGNRLHRTKSGDSKGSSVRYTPEPVHVKALEIPNEVADETSSLMSSSSISDAGENQENRIKTDAPAHDAHHVDVRGLKMIPTIEFWQLFSLLGLLTGIGLMSINNIGNDAQALWSYYDDSSTPDSIQQRQLLHVSILSFMSFSGRLLSGVGSDIIVKKLHLSRFWCLFVSSGTFCIAQICGTQIENPNLLIFVSGTTGLAYGFLFGVFPSLVAEAFGINGLSQNWGWMTLSPVISGNVFNLLYGRIYDYHSVIKNGRRACPDGIECYRTAYWVTFGASLAGMLISLWSIRHDNVIKSRRRKAELEAVREA